MNHGLSTAAVNCIVAVFSHHPEIEKAVLYGSRAKGNYRTGSDIDLTLFGRDLDLKLLGRIDGEFDDSSLPYKIDLSIFSNLTHPDLNEHIQRVGVVFYEKTRVEVKH